MVLTVVDINYTMQTNSPNSLPYVVLGSVCLGLFISFFTFGTTILYVEKKLGPSQHAPSWREDGSIEIPRFSIGDEAPMPSVKDLKKNDLEASIDMDAEDACSVCYAHKVSVVFHPCGHSFACDHCAQFFAKRPCGICRTEVESMVPVALESPSGEKRESEPTKGATSNSETGVATAALGESSVAVELNNTEQ
jgi:hypothetical protein